jgi:hypothetical protein
MVYQGFYFVEAFVDAQMKIIFVHINNVVFYYHESVFAGFPLRRKTISRMGVN